MNSERASQILISAGWVFVREQNGLFVYRRIADGKIRAFTHKQLDAYAIGMQDATIDAEIDAAPELQEMQNEDSIN